MARNDYEAPDLTKAVDRILRSLVSRADEGDLEALSALAEIQRQAGHRLGEAVEAAHTGHNAYSWREIARELGITRQAAQQRFSKEQAS